jgi:hypothetical protein
VTRTGEPVRTARFMAGRVLALVEHPANESQRERKPSEDGSYEGFSPAFGASSRSPTCLVDCGMPSPHTLPG